MRLATLRDGTKDGRLVVVSPDGTACAPAPVTTLQQALEDWVEVEPALRAIGAFPDVLDPAQVMAPLPRAWQWLDGSLIGAWNHWGWFEPVNEQCGAMDGAWRAVNCTTAARSVC